MNKDELIYGYKFRELHSPCNIEYYDTHHAMIANYFRASDCQKSILITHNSDCPVSSAYPKNMSSWPTGVTWFSTNVDIEHPNIKSIPIGLENPEWHPEKTGYINAAILIKNNNRPWLFNAIFNPETHKSRAKILNHFGSIAGGISCLSINGSNINPYYTCLLDSKFTICPRGNGIDTHRFWEALYCGSIPIVEDCINIRQFYKLGIPMIIVPDLSLVTKQDMMKWAETYTPPENWEEKLTMSYWIKQIKDSLCNIST